MSEVKFTPGPHYAVEYAGRIEMQSIDDYGPGYDLLDADDVGEEVMQANGTLYASATDLLGALESLTLSVKAHPDYTGQENDEWTDLVNIAEKAIKRAKGL
jgi:hypothetical protein